MAGNLGRTSLKCKRRSSDPMRDYDRLPRELRIWLSGAVLPWRPRSVRRAFDAALSRTGGVGPALAELDRIERNIVSKDARKIWGHDHPNATNVNRV
ncbi:DUF6525 family protein [Halocynthiibacter sp. C4]|uniref:DUF6525 family protein n=1 Tax=Halocynthiibacter sp. C4 TaxID=2992758 RepID=UPI00237BE0DE|nr:DUF6525 family protein [Halocynthiibacter sp. C4]MDE0589818.1 DUF6525 family protein [Halocynthiibacter sp. C4]